MKKQLTWLAVWSVFAAGAGAAQAFELLTNGYLDIQPQPPGWSLSETVTGSPGSFINSAHLQIFNIPAPTQTAGQTGLRLDPFSGNIGSYSGQNKKINAILSQTVPHTGVTGEVYTFTGYSRWESNYSGAVTTLDSLSPSGAVPSPTQSIWELAFLDGSSAVIGTPVTFDLRTPVAMGGQTGDFAWRQHTLTGPAPAGTANVRVTASATDMVFNIDPQQSGDYEAFSLTRANASTTEMLTNGGLNAAVSQAIPSWTLTQTQNSTQTPQASLQGFASHSGGQGLWLMSFNNGDAVLEQTVPGVAGVDYLFAGWSKWETNYSGGQPADGAPDTFTTMQLAFLDGSSAVIGTPVTLDLRTEQSNGAGWKQHFLNGTAPAGTVSVRVRASMDDGFFTMDPNQSAFFDDFSLDLTADYHDDGRVDAADYVLWRNDGSLQNELSTRGTATAEDYDAWRARFGNSAVPSGSGSSLTAAVPEPACGLLAVIALMGGVGMRRRWPSALSR